MDSADIRKGLYNHLVANVPQVSGRVFWEYTASAETVKPFLEMAFMSDIPSVNTPLGMFIRLEVLVVGEEANIIALDPIADMIVSIMHKQDVMTPDLRVIVPEYRRDSKFDFWYEILRASAIRLEFWIPTDFWT